MNFTKTKPQFVEELIFRVDPTYIDAYIEADYETFGKTLSRYPGYLGGEVWASKTEPGLLHNIIFWESEEALRAIPKEVAAECDARLNAIVGEGRITFVAARHASEPFEKIAEVK